MSAIPQVVSRSIAVVKLPGVKGIVLPFIPVEVVHPTEEHRAAPFIQVNLRPGGDGSFTCACEDECLTFADTLAQATSHSERPALLSALIYVLRGHIYEAAFALYDWVTRENRGVIQIPGMLSDALPNDHRWPSYDFTCT